MNRDSSLPPEPLPLTEASIQEIQLELIRRHTFNFFDGKRIVASLRQHRRLWKAVIMDRLGFSSEKGPGCGSLIKLRSLASSYWNVDQLFILCDTLEDARHLEAIAVDEEWNADQVEVHENLQDRKMTLGTSDPGFIVSMWWD